jgi:hypothetical protein
MTTTPTASPELPDLDKLEALARAATPGPWAYQEDSDVYTHIVRPVQCPGRIVHHYSQDTSGVVEANARFTAGANPAAVLELIALARSAALANHPAPTVSLEDRPEDDQQWAKVDPAVAFHLIERHAEDWADAGRLMLQWYNAISRAAHQEPVAAPQQAAAPSALAIEAAKLAPILRGMCEGGDVHGDGVDIYADDYIAGDGDTYVVRAAALLEQIAAPSAPGTPEAPAEERKGIELWRATLRACGELPEGYEVRIELENGCGMVAWYDERGERHVIDGEGYLSDDVNEAVELAIQRAAAPKGGA